MDRLKIPFLNTSPPPDPAAKAAATAKMLDAKAADETSKQERSQSKRLAKLERRAKRREAELATAARVAGAKADFRAKHPNARGVIGWVREQLAGLAGSLDRVSTTTFIQIADRGMMLAIIGIIILCFGLD